MSCRQVYQWHKILCGNEGHLSRTLRSVALWAALPKKKKNSIMLPLCSYFLFPWISKCSYLGKSSDQLFKTEVMFPYGSGRNAAIFNRGKKRTWTQKTHTPCQSWSQGTRNSLLYLVLAGGKEKEIVCGSKLQINIAAYRPSTVISAI